LRIAVLATAIVTGAFGVAAQSRAPDRWTAHQVASRLTHFSGIAGSSTKNVIAVGTRGAIFRFDGSRWAEQRSGTNRHLADVWVGSPASAFAVGLDGVILEYGGTEWEGRTSGTRRFDGDGFRTVHSDARFHYQDVWRAGTGEVFVAGTNGYVLTEASR
jgi:hypothetical protein